MMKHLLIIALALVAFTNGWAQTATAPAVGDGSESSPYEIATFENLYWLTTNDGEWNNHYIQTADINASESFTMSKGLNTIGDDGDDFMGSYDGQGYTIDSVYISRYSGTDKAYQYIALFGRTNGATFANINLTNCDITGYKYVAGLVGYDYVGSTITNCSVSNATIEAINNGTSQDYVGGLAGYAKESAISNCYTSNATVIGDDYIGGFLGYSYKSAISDCYALGTDVTGADDYIGGLVGYIKYSAGTIDNSYSTGSVTGNASVGGLVGYDNNCGGISNSYSSASVYGDGDASEGSIGGLIGQSKGTITNCYSVGKVSTIGTDVGPFIGYNNGATVTSCYYNSESASISDNATGTAKTTAELKLQATFTDWDFTSIWEISEAVTYAGFQNLTDPIIMAGADDVIMKIGETHTYTFELISQDKNESTITYELVQKPEGMLLADKTVTWTPTKSGAYPVEFMASYSNGMSSSVSYLVLVLSLNGDGSESSPYEISSLEQLRDLSEIDLLWTSNFIQTANIDASASATWNEGAGFSPIGSENSAFTGNYDGQGFTIDSIYINRAETDYVGIFGYGMFDTIQNLAVTNAYVTGGTYTGALIGRMHGAVAKSCYTSGSVIGTSNVGGLTGRNWDGLIRNCYSTASVEGNDIVGGLVGEYKGTITNCYATGLVKGVSQIGGLIGNEATADSYIVSGSYFISEINGATIDSVLGMGKPLAEMMMDTSYATWNLADTFEITNGVTLPRIKVLANGPVILQTALEVCKAGVEHKDTLTVIAMDNETLTIELVKFPEGMIITNNVITWTPSTTAYDTIVVKASDGAGVATYYSYNLTTTNLDGSGTADMPFEIATAADLVELMNTSLFWSSYFVQTADIDLSSVADYSPIGSSSIPFEGSYSGKGFTLSGLSINSDLSTITSSDKFFNIGLFGKIEGATIDSVRLVNSFIAGMESVGALVGYSTSSTISNCYSNATVSGTFNTGGLVGYAKASTISKCYNDGNVNGRVYFDMDYGISITPNWTGGLVANLRDASVIEYSYSTAKVDGEFETGTYIGGLVGYLKSASVFNSYATGAVFGKKYVGGFVGGADRGDDAPVIENCYSIGFVSTSSTSNVGGFDGYFTYTAQAVNCYFNSETSGQDASSDGIPKTTAEMLDQATYTDWNFDNIWTVTENTYPTLDTLSNNAPFAFADTIEVAGNSSVLVNDYDYETGQTALVTKLISEPEYGYFADNYYRFNYGSAVGSRDTLIYRVGEVTAMGDTLWGNNAVATFVKIVNNAPVITAVVNKTTNEDVPVAITMDDITASDFDGDKLFVVITTGTNFTTVSPTVIVPDAGFYGDLTVGIAVNDGNMNSDTLSMTITVVAIPDVTTITWATPDTVTYGSAIGDAVLNAETTSVGTMSYSFVADSVFDVGANELVATFTPTEANDYTAATDTVIYVVEQAMLTVTANDHTILLDAAIPELTLTYTGFANNDTESVLDVAPTASTLATSTSPVGDYAITVSGGSDNNYAFTYVEGMLTISSFTVSVSELQIEAKDNLTATFDITSGIAWSVASSESWLTANTTTGNSDATVTLTAEENTGDVRTATITVSAEGAVDQMITVTQLSGLGVNNENISDISVYPNPASSVVNVTNVANTTVDIFDITGQLVYTKNVVSEIEQINVSDFNAGIYIINITNDMTTVSKRLIIE